MSNEPCEHGYSPWTDCDVCKREAYEDQLYEEWKDRRREGDEN